MGGESTENSDRGLSCCHTQGPSRNVPVPEFNRMIGQTVVLREMRILIPTERTPEKATAEELRVGMAAFSTTLLAGTMWRRGKFSQ